VDGFHRVVQDVQPGCSATHNNPSRGIEIAKRTNDKFFLSHRSVIKYIPTRNLKMGQRGIQEVACFDDWAKPREGPGLTGIVSSCGAWNKT
jgi:hypothetical protein